MRKLMIILGTLAAAGLPLAAGAAPILAVDVDIATAGIQSTTTVAPGSVFSVDIVIAGVEVGGSLNGFEFDLDFAASVLSATSVLDGGFLLPVRFPIEADLAGSDVNFAEVTLGSSGAVGGGVLARVTFQALGVGTSFLNLNDLILTSVVRPGVVVTLPIVGITNASVLVADDAGPVIPEPTAALLFASGGVTLAAAIRQRRRTTTCCEVSRPS